MRITSEEFDRAADAFGEDLTTAEILSLPGVWEIVREVYNNDIIQRALDMRDDDDDDD